MTANGNGNGHRSAPAPAMAGSNGADHLAALATMDAPGRLGYVLANVTGADITAARRFLREVGHPVSITGARNDEADSDGAGMHAPHPINIEDAGWSYSAHGSPGHEDCGCASRARGAYQGARPTGDLPYFHARLMIPDGRASVAAFLASRTATGPRQVITWKDLELGTWMHRLGMGGQSRARHVRDAVATAVFALAYDSALPERPLSLTPSARTDDGRVPVPDWATLPPGYGDQPPDGPARDAARAAWTAIAARCPQVALVMGASLAAPLAAAAGIQSALWELVAGPRLGKTTTIQLAAAMWGRPALPPEPGILVSWDASPKGMSRLSGMLGTLPLFADESGTADIAPAGWAQFTYGQTQGASRLVSSFDGQPRKTPGWAGFMFLSGNGSITEGVRAGKFAGVPARVLTLGGPFTESGADCDALAAAVAADYGHVGPAVLEAVTVARFREWHAEARALIGAADGGTLGTNGGQLAAAVAALRAADEVLGTGTALTDAGAAAARDYLGTVAEPETDREIALRALGEAMASDRASWPDLEAYDATGRPDDSVPGQPASRNGIPWHGVGRVAGVRHDGWLHVFPAAWGALTEAAMITGPRALADMHARGELHVAPSLRARGDWKSPGPRHAEGRRLPYGYRILLAAITPPGDDDDQAPAPADPAPASSWPAGSVGATAAPAPRADAREVQADNAAPMFASPVTNTPAPVANTAPAAGSAAEFTAERRGQTSRIKTPEQWECVEAAAALLDENPDVADKDAVRSLANRLHLLDALEGSGRDNWGGPFLPKRGGKGAKLHPWGKGGVPTCVDDARVIEGYTWERDDYRGAVTVLDRNAAWVTAAATARVAHGALTRSGECEPGTAPAPGYYLTTVYPWAEAGMPAPLGNAQPGESLWVPGPTMALLTQLAEQGRWPDAIALDSWTGEAVQASEWAHLTGELRRYALDRYGYGSGAYEAVKQAFSQSVAMWAGVREPGRPRAWPKCKTHRIDWRHAWITHASAQMWRTLDNCRHLAADDPALLPVGIRNKDELLIPAAAVELVTAGLDAAWRLRIDQTGREFGAFKVKGAEAR